MASACFGKSVGHKWAFFILCCLSLTCLLALGGYFLGSITKANAETVEKAAETSISAFTAGGAGIGLVVGGGSGIFALAMNEKDEGRYFEVSASGWRIAWSTLFILCFLAASFLCALDLGGGVGVRIVFGLIAGSMALTVTLGWCYNMGVDDAPSKESAETTSMETPQQYQKGDTAEAEWHNKWYRVEITDVNEGTYGVEWVGEHIEANNKLYKSTTKTFHGRLRNSNNTASTPRSSPATPSRGSSQAQPSSVPDKQIMEGVLEDLAETRAKAATRERELRNLNSAWGWDRRLASSAAAEPTTRPSLLLIPALLLALLLWRFLRSHASSNRDTIVLREIVIT